MKLSGRIALATLLILGSSGALYALAKHGDWRMTPDEKIEFVGDRVTNKLDLDAHQRQKFDELANLVAQMMGEVRGTRAQHAREVTALFDDPSFNQVRALEMIETKTRQINEKAPLAIASLAAFLDSLSAEQRAELRAYVERHHDHDGHRHFGHGP